jgi:hypothetical protein
MVAIGHPNNFQFDFVWILRCTKNSQLEADNKVFEDVAIISSQSASGTKACYNTIYNG